MLFRSALAFDVRPAHLEERWPAQLDVRSGVLALAQQKLDAVAGDCVLAADTIVVLGDTPLGKPQDDADAARMLTNLSRRSHHVLTGFCIRVGDAVHSEVVSTTVSFRELSASEIDAYVASGEPHDKAGAYAIQGRGGAFVDRIEGSYTNVVGLPLREVLEALEALGCR